MAMQLTQDTALKIASLPVAVVGCAIALEKDYLHV